MADDLIERLSEYLGENVTDGMICTVRAGLLREAADALSRAEADAKRLDSGTLCICERSTFGTMFKMTYTGIDMRAAIDAAMGGEVGK